MHKIIILNMALIMLIVVQPTANKESGAQTPKANITDRKQEDKKMERIFVAPKLKRKVYAVSTLAKVNWHTALQICGSHGLTLATIQSEQEKNLLKAHLKENGIQKNEKYFWLGGSDLGKRYTWAWISNGRPFNYTNWAKGEPNNKGGNQRCVSLHMSGRWLDLECYSKHYFICESLCDIDGKKEEKKKEDNNLFVTRLNSLMDPTKIT